MNPDAVFLFRVALSGAAVSALSFWILEGLSNLTPSRSPWVVYPFLGVFVLAVLSSITSATSFFVLIWTL